MKVSFTQSLTDEVFAKLKEANQEFSSLYPGESAARQPVHTVYGGAQLFKANAAGKLGDVALRTLNEYAPDFTVLGHALRLPGCTTFPSARSEISALSRRLERSPEAVRAEIPGAWLAWAVYNRVVDKLRREPVEDFRIDFEDGYGVRPDTEEDGHAQQAAEEVAAGLENNLLPPFIGIRVKPFTEELKQRSARTLDIFVSTLVDRTGGRLPDNFVVTLPKVTIPEQVEAFVELLRILEEKTALRPGSLKIELMIETTQSLINHAGQCNVPLLVAAARTRCVACHFGTYDYTACCNITAHYQVMDHPSCDFARQMLKVALAGTGIWLSDGATNVMPVRPHRAGVEGAGLTEEQARENRQVVHRAWKLGYDHIQHSLKHAYYQGWDLHPAQLPIRYAACYTFFLEGLEAASVRLRTFVEKAAQATLLGDVFDDAATGQGLLNYFLRALNCGAITMDEVKETGLTLDEIRSRSFVKIMSSRRL